MPAIHPHTEIQLAIYDRVQHEEFDTLVAGQLDFPKHIGQWSLPTQESARRALQAWKHESMGTLQANGAKATKALQNLLQSPMAQEPSMAFHEQVESLTDDIKENYELQQRLSEMDISTIILPPRPPCRIQSVLLETPVFVGNNYKVGNIDVLVSYRAPQLVTPELLLSLFPKEMSSDHLDLCEIMWGHECLAEFECKSVIHDIGELLRQLHDHRRGFKRELKQFVVSPDTRYHDLLRDQGFGFIPYDPTEADESDDLSQVSFDFRDL